MPARAQRLRPVHQRASERQRGTARARGYDARWEKRRAAQLERQPWCEACVRADMGNDPRAMALMANRQLVAALIASYMAGRTGFGRVEAPIARATDVDHRVDRKLFPPELRGGDAPGGSDHEDNLESLCHSCHSRKTREENPQRAVR